MDVIREIEEAELGDRGAASDRWRLQGWCQSRNIRSGNYYRGAIHRYSSKVITINLLSNGLLRLVVIHLIHLLNLLFLLHLNSLLCRLGHLVICLEKLIVWIALKLLGGILKLLISGIQITIIFLFAEQPQ